MNNILQQILGIAPAQAAPVRPTYDRAMERRARANGFRSAEEMMLWAKQRNTPTGGTIPSGGRPSVKAGMNAAASIHPKNILSYVLGKTTGALGY
jgi:hypothetical protein